MDSHHYTNKHCIKRLLIDCGSVIRIACMTDKKLKEIYIDNDSMVGHIINGVVQNILPSKFAFIDIGQGKNAFLNLPPDSRLKPGEYIPVQVRKDATGSKGANLSDILQLKGRFAIVYPGGKEIGVSSKIADKNERKRLQNLGARLLPTGYSCILRTQASGRPEELLQSELNHLVDLCQKITCEAKYSPAPKILYRENFILNDLLTDDIDEIIINDRAAYSGLKDQSAKLWDMPEDLFQAFDVEQQIARALHRKVWLPCGGFVTFDPVEACVVIDVNSGKFTGKKNYRESVLKINLESAACIAEQIALRNLSGMIIVDFIDMPLEEDKNTLLGLFRDYLKKDRIPADIVGMTELGLVQLTRRKQREPLSSLLQRPCPHCGGDGRVRA